MPITTQASSPYFDDFNTQSIEDKKSIEDKNYQSILFKPGYSVQNRELNQLQSMLRAQLDKFGSAFYTNGAAVVDGSVTFNKDVRSVDIEVTPGITINVELITVIVNAAGVRADVIGYELLTTTPNQVYRFFIRYRTSDLAGGTSSIFAVDEVVSTNISIDPFGDVQGVGYAVAAFANKGIFFVKGSFVLNQSQRVFFSIPDKDYLFNGLVVFKITESIVTAISDETLYDNATGSPNFSAPGADRQAISLELKLVTEEPSYDFSTLLNIIDSTVLSPARPAANTSGANSLNDILATRTYEESGNYSVRPFKLAMREHFNTGSNFGKYTESQLAAVFPNMLAEERIGESKSKYVAGVEPSVAYVKGYRVALTDRKDLTGNKARSYQSIENVSFTAAQGNYILTTGMTFANNSHLPDICNAALTFNLYSTETSGGTLIGTCKIRNIEQISTTVFQIFIYDLALQDSLNLLAAKRLALDGATGSSSRFTNSGGFALYDSGNNTNIFKFPFDAVKSITSLRYGVRKYFTATSTAATFTGPNGTEGKWINIPHPTVGPAGKFESQSLTDYIIIDHTASTTGAIPVTVVYIDDGSGLWLLAPTVTASQVVSVVAPYTVTNATNTKSSLTAATQTAPSPTLIGRSVTFVLGTERVSLTAHGLSNGDRVIFSTIAANTSGIYTDTPYYVINKTNNDFQLSLTRGATSIVLINDAGGGGAHSGVMNSYSIIALTNRDIVASSVQVKNVGRSVAWVVADNKVTLATHGLVDGDKVIFTALGTATNISTGVTYYVTNKTTNDFQISLTLGGSVIDITGTNATNGTMDSIVTGFSIEDGASLNHFNAPLLVYTSTTPITGTLTITYNYYPHTAATGLPYIVNSYSGSFLEDIPSFNGNRLSDSIDFRFDNSPASAVRLDSNSTIVATVQYYLPRIDNILVNSSGQFYISEGISSLNPVAPAIPGDSMSLYSLYIPAYTYTTDDILPRFVDNKRYTMRDIGAIEKRVANIEYYTSLSLLEKSAQDKQILTSGGLERYKNGILVDSFFGHNIADVENAGHKCSIDQVNGILRPYYTTKNLDLKIDSAVNTNPLLNSNDNTTSIAYTNVELIKQSFATANAESVNPFDMQVWNGTVELSPSSDEWKSTTVRPAVIINDTSAYDAVALIAETEGILGYHWNEWEVNWSGTTVVNKKLTKAERRAAGTSKLLAETTTTSSTSIRDGTRTTLSYTDNTQSFGEKVVDISYIPFIRSRKVYFKADRLKPNTRVYPFFDGVDISDYTVTKIDLDAVLFVPFKDQTDSTIYDGNDDPLGSTAPTAIISDATGKATGYFIIPNHSSLKFNTGERSFKLVDSPSNDETDFTTFAETKYHASGLLETKQNTILSTRVAKFDAARVSESRTNADTVKVRYHDPLAQSFILDENQIDGAYITKLDLYFKKKSTKGVPVSVYVVTMENGMPTQNILPFSSVTKDAVDVVIADEESLATWLPTTFTFDAPVYLQPGVEYAFVVLSNDSDYMTFVSEVGKENIVPGNAQLIAKNPYAGVMFKSQNGSTWTADQSKDITFTLYRANFDTSASIKEVKLQGLNTVNPLETVSFSSLRTTVENIVQNNTEILWKLSITDTTYGLFEYDINVNETIDFDRRFTTLKNGITLTGYLNTDTKYLSPYIDTDRTSVLLIDNEINSDLTNESIQDKGSASARYITRVVDLNNSANQLNIYIAANRPTASENILVYVKAQIRDEAIYANEPWTLLSPSTILPVSSNTDNYSEISYTYSPARLFSRFSVKIVLTSTTTNGANVPSVKDFRAIATYGA